jgi:hypothetical protein
VEREVRWLSDMINAERTNLGPRPDAPAPQTASEQPQ